MAAGAPIARPLDVRWIHGSPSAKHNTDPDIQVHEYDEHTVILRQNKAINYEAPFLYLLFGAERAVLIDTGATAQPEFFPVRTVVDELIGKWLARNPRDDYGLLVLHTHPHGDHVAGDGQFTDRPGTTLVAADRATAWPYFGFDQDAEAVARVDLGGGRVLRCLAAPGHHEAAVTYYDPWTGFLLTGDTVYPGRLYIDDWAAFGRTIDRLIAFTEQHTVTHVLGCHIEMTRDPGVDYPIRTTYQPDEPPLQLTTAHLHAIRAALAELGGQPTRHALADLVLWPSE
ncbi:MBL fold metallo-hydrolase [Kitasatospora sp. NPDC097643]|uniref:MBL fold metallo-hydrolase n=1 Tax=Kitasatospora sp. NPDC097643 TaxID=3157230 RepID=UPI0033251A82